MRMGGLPGATADLVERLEAYKRLILHWNKRIPLVSRRSQEGSAERLISHSMQAAGVLPGMVQTLIDVGSGAGFPGLPIAMARPKMHVKLVERSANKQLFLREAIRTLEVENVELIRQTFSQELVCGERALAVTAMGLGGYADLAGSVKPKLESGDGLLLFVRNELAGEIARALGRADYNWKLLEGSERAGVAWIEMP